MSISESYHDGIFFIIIESIQLMKLIDLISSLLLKNVKSKSKGRRKKTSGFQLVTREIGTYRFESVVKKSLSCI